MNYKKISALEYCGNCSEVSLEEWEKRMKGAKRANQKEIEKLLVKFGLNNGEDFKFYNPYKSLRTEKYLIYVHSLIEYFYEFSY